MSQGVEVLDVGMTKGRKRYPVYKESGIEWLGAIPEHWEVTKLKHGYETCLGKMLQPQPANSLDTLEPYLRVANIYWEGVDISDVKKMWFSPNEKKTYRIEENDLLVSEGGDVGRATIWKGELPNCYIQNAVHRIRNKKGYNNKILYYWLFFLKNIGYIDLICSKATIAHFTAEKVKEIPILNIPLPEIQSILIFLDQETSKIDNLVAKKERLIELLKEKRTALISHAVTKGLNPDAPLKDSGIEWLGQIPEHWEVTKLKHGYETCLGKMLQSQPATSLDTLGPYLRVANIYWEGVDISDVKKMWFSPNEKKTYRIEENDLLVSEGGDVGRATIWKGELPNCYIQNAVHRIRNKKGYNNKILYYWLFFLKNIGYIDLICSKATIAHFTAEKVKEIPILNIPLPEIQSILIFLDQETSKIDTLIAKTQISIEKLKEYRTALISAAVTGKIDVRE